MMDFSSFEVSDASGAEESVENSYETRLKHRWASLRPCKRRCRSRFGGREGMGILRSYFFSSLYVCVLVLLKLGRKVVVRFELKPRESAI